MVTTGNDQPVEADAGGLDGDDFAVAVEHAEGDQRSNEHRQRRDLVEHAGRKVQQILADDGESNVIAQDVAHQIEEGEDDHEQHEAGQNEQKHADEFAQDVLVEDARKNAARLGAVRAAGSDREAR